jgi:hypothetical protein
MTLKPQESSELEFIQVLKSKHARYINRAVVDTDAVGKDYVKPGAAMGKITASGLYGPVTRGAVDLVTSASNLFTLSSEAEAWNLQVGDELETLDIDGAVITPNALDNLVVTAIDGADITVTNIESVEHDAAAYIQKADGSSSAEFVCLQLIDVSDDEDVIVGGIVHGAIYKDRMANYDASVEEDLPQVSFE